MKKTLFAVTFGALSLITWGIYAQNQYFQTPTAEEVCEREWEEEAENEAVKQSNACDSEEREHCPCPRNPNRWKEDYFEEAQYHDNGWPSRRDDEFSDQLSR